MAVFTLPLPTALATGGGGVTSTISTSQSSIQLDANGSIGTIIAKTNNKDAFFIDSNQRMRIGSAYNSLFRCSIDDVNGSCLELVYNSSLIRSNFTISSIGDLLISTYSDVIKLPSNVKINGHNGVDSGLYLNDVLVTATATQLNYVNTTPGITSPLKALIVDNNRDISNINSLTASSISGTIQTPNQPNITSVNTLNIVGHNSSTSGLSLNGILVTASAAQLNYLNVVPGTVTENKAVVVNNTKSITGLTTISSTNVVGTLTTEAQPNITSIGTLNNLRVNGLIGISRTATSYGLEINSSSGNCLQLCYNQSSGSQNSVSLTVTPSGSLSINPSGSDIIIGASRRLVFSGSGEIIGVSTMNVSSIYGTMFTSNQPNITNVGTLTSLRVSGSIGIGTNVPSKKVEIGDANGECLRLSFNTTPNVVSTQFTDISVNASGNLIIAPTGNRIILPSNTTIQFISNGSITGMSNFSATTLSGILTTSSQPNITSIGTLSSLTMNGSISGVDELTASKYYGIIMTSNQPNITSIGNLTNLVVTGTLTGLNSLTSNEIYGTIKTSAQPNITSIGTLGSLIVNGPITGVTTITATNLSGTLSTSSQPNINSIGTLSQLNVSGDVNISSNITANKIYGILHTAAQPNITSVGTLTNLVVNDTISGANKVSATHFEGTILTDSQPNITSIGTLTALNMNGAITGVTTITATNLSGTLSTSLQPNITSLGTITNLRTNGSVGISIETPSKKVEIRDNNGDCLRLSRMYVNNIIHYADFIIDTSGYLSFQLSGNGIALGTNKNILMSNGDITGVQSINALSISGTIQTSIQPNITDVGILTNLSVDGKIGINCLTTPSKRVEIKDASGDFIRMVYDGAQSKICDITMNYYGDLIISPEGNNIRLSQNTNIILNGGIITGLSSFSAVSLGGTLTTNSQPNITSVGTLNNLSIEGKIALNKGYGTYTTEISSDDGKCLKLYYDANNTLSSIFTRFDVTNSGNLSIVTTGDTISIGTDTNIQLNGNNSSILGVKNISAVTLGGTLTSSIQTNITSVGTLTNLQVDGSTGIGTSTPSMQLEINHSGGQCLRLSYNAPTGNASTYCDFVLNSSGFLQINPSGGLTTLTTNTSLQLSGTGKITSPQMILGNTTRTTMPLEVGTVAFNMTSAYAYNNNVNGHGIVSAGSTTVYNYSIRTDGRILCTGSVDVTSDRRLKKNIRPLQSEYCERFIRTANPIVFNWKKGDTGTMFGYIAQDLLKAGFGELVNVAEETGLEEYIDEENFISPKNIKFTVSYENIIPILACNQRKLIKENEMLRKELDDIKKLIKTKLDIPI